MHREETGWRDEEISRRHRQYGYNAPAVDVDFMLVEYDTGTPKAIIDYKRSTSGVWDRDKANQRALGALYDSAGQQLPFFIVRYDPNVWSYWVHARNNAAEAWMDQLNCIEGQYLNEYDYVRFLYILRGRDMPLLALFADRMHTTA